MEMLPERKNIRLKAYDYSQAGCYFITICVKDRREMLGKIDVGAIINRPFSPVRVTLSEYGIVTDNVIHEIPVHCPHVSVDQYTIMPNHIHLLLTLWHDDDPGRLIIAPTNVSTVVQQFKRRVSKLIGFSIWQKSFHDHIIRSEADYQRTWRYIDENPARWIEDDYYENSYIVNT